MASGRIDCWTKSKRQSEGKLRIFYSNESIREMLSSNDDPSSKRARETRQLFLELDRIDSSSNRFDDKQVLLKGNSKKLSIIAILMGANSLRVVTENVHRVSRAIIPRDTLSCPSQGEMSCRSELREQFFAEDLSKPICQKEAAYRIDFPVTPLATKRTIVNHPRDEEEVAARNSGHAGGDSTAIEMSTVLLPLVAPVVGDGLPSTWAGWKSTIFRTAACGFFLTTGGLLARYFFNRGGAGQFEEKGSALKVISSLEEYFAVDDFRGGDNTLESDESWEVVPDNQSTPKAEAYVLPNSNKKAGSKDVPASPPLDEPKIEKMDFSCIEERTSITWEIAFRQIGKTLKDPLNELAKESQVIYYYNNYEKCPEKADVDKLSYVMERIDFAAKFIMSMSPSLNRVVVVQDIGSELFQRMADEISKQADVRKYGESWQLLFDAVSVGRRDLIDPTYEERRGPFHDVYHQNKGAAYAVIRGEVWRLSIRDGKIFASRKNEDLEVKFIIGKLGHSGRWKFADEAVNEFMLHDVEAEFLKDVTVVPSRFTGIRRDEGAAIFDVELKDGMKLKCVHIDGHMVPVRNSGRGTGVEAYNANSPSDVGRPIVRSGRIWKFGTLKKPRLYFTSEESNAGRGIVSNSLRQSLAQNFLRSDIDSSSMSRPDSRGIVTSNDGKDYLEFQEGLIEIESIPRAANAYIIKGQGGLKIVSRYDAESQQFIDEYEDGKYLNAREDGTYEWMPCAQPTRRKRGAASSCLRRSEEGRAAEEFPLEEYEPIREQTTDRQPSRLDQDIGAPELLTRLDNIPEIGKAIRSPDGKCDAIIPTVAKFALENGFSNVRYRAIVMWSGATMTSRMVNHYAVVARKNGMDYVFDLTAGQFENRMPGLVGPIIAREEDWAEIYISGSRTWLIKFRDFDDRQSAIDHFSVPVMDPMQPIENAVVLKAPSWYMKIRNGEVSRNF